MGVCQDLFTKILRKLLSGALARRSGKAGREGGLFPKVGACEGNICRGTLTVSLETFKIIYLSVSVCGAVIAFWLLRRDKQGILTLSVMTFLFAIFLFSFYIDAKRGFDFGPLMEYLLHALIAVQPDLTLTIGNLFLWGTVPFACAIRFSRKKGGSRLVWALFLAVALLKTLFDDEFIIHQYSRILAHSFEWGYVLFAWGVIYALAGLFVTKGIESLTGEDR